MALPTDLNVSDEVARRNFEILGAKVGALTQLHFEGVGSPETVVTAARSAHYHRRDGGAGTCLYVHEGADGTNTGWVAK